MNLDNTVWQQLMTSAYDKWQDGNVKYERWLSGLPRVEMDAVLLGNLNYQVENGGITQYVDNGYCSCNYHPLLALLLRIDTPRSIELSDKLHNFCQKFVNVGKKAKSPYNNWLCESDDEIFDEALQAASTKFDNWYYSKPFHDEFMADVEKFMTEQSNNDVTKFITDNSEWLTQQAEFFDKQGTLQGVTEIGDDYVLVFEHALVQFDKKEKTIVMIYPIVDFSSVKQPEGLVK